MKNSNLGTLEKQVMDIVWYRKNCNVHDVINSLDKRLAYTTVATILHRLYLKGFLKRKIYKKEYFYYPRLSKENYSKKVVVSFMDNFIKTYGEYAIASFAEGIEKLPLGKRKHLLEVLESHDKNK